MSAFDIFNLLGGIALFLFGMQMMSDGLERAAGSKMRQILESLTKNRLIGTLVGVAITAIIQSSSAVTATVVSFVNAGLMDLAQSVGVIFGANIGTSVTGQLMAFKLDEFAPLIIAVATICYLFLKKDIVKRIAFVVLGFGVLFLGLGMMKSAMSTLASSPSVMGAIENASNPFLLVFIGLVITAIIQSNSAVTGILIGMSASGLISLDACFYVILGSNIGACVTAIIASLNGNRKSKRAALIHLFFNIIGTIIIFILLTFLKEPITKFILMLSPGETSEIVASRAVAMANTVFRVFNVIIMFPFANGLVKLTQLVIPVKDHSNDVEDYSKLKFVGDNTLTSPSVAMVSTANEIERIGKHAFENLEMAVEGLLNRDDSKLPVITKNEDEIDVLTSQLQEYMVKVTQMRIPIADQQRISGYFHTIIDIERLSDHAMNIAESGRDVIKYNVKFSKNGMEELDEMCHKALYAVKQALEIFINRDTSKLRDFMKVEEQMDALEKKYQANHIKRMTQGVCSPKSGMFADILSNLERIGDLAVNIAFSIGTVGTDAEIEKYLESIPEN